MTDNKQGFTLVELAIVLVIIGLLIGGILVARSMISSAQINSAISQVSQFDAGTMSFKARYNYLPGDAPVFGGDGDGLIEFGSPAQYDDRIDVYTNEIGRYWHNMDPSQFPGESTGVGGTGVVTEGPTKNAPISKLGKPGSFFVAGGTSWDGAQGFSSDPRNSYYIVDPSQGRAPLGGTYYHFLYTDSTNSPVKPADTLALDKKLDDGLADSGYVVAGKINGVWNGGEWGGPSYVPLPSCANGPAYTVENDSFECTPLIRIGIQSGTVNSY